MTKEQREKFLNLACQLSPENISWDGERSRSEIDKARKKLMREWAALEREVGRVVTETEVWSFSNATNY
jgi:hypothetical protein